MKTLSRRDEMEAQGHIASKWQAGPGLKMGPDTEAVLSLGAHDFFLFHGNLLNSGFLDWTPLGSSGGAFVYL